jgi:hypothetical protein
VLVASIGFYEPKPNSFYGTKKKLFREDSHVDIGVGLDEALCVGNWQLHQCYTPLCLSLLHHRQNSHYHLHWHNHISITIGLVCFVSHRTAKYGMPSNNMRIKINILCGPATPFETYMTGCL